LLFDVHGAFVVDSDLDRLLDHCNKLDFSDLYIQTGWPVIAAIHGRKHLIIKRRMRSGEVIDIINALYGYENASALISTGSPVDTDYDFRPERGVRHRYRVNGSGVMVNGSSGIQITIRRLMATPPRKGDIGLTDDVIKMFTGYDNGVAIISGTTGSGKSTTLAAIIRDTLEADEGKIILTAESPIEYVYDELIDNALGGTEPSMISSSSIPLNFKSFENAGVAALRRAPDIFLIGEARDAETIDAVIEGSNTGHLVWATTHSNGAPMTVRRLIQKYSPEIQSAKMSDLAEALRVVMSQTLAKTMDGKRVAIREVLPFTEDVREHIMGGESSDVYRLAREALIHYGTPMIRAAIPYYDDGIINQDELDKIERTFGSDR